MNGDNQRELALTRDNFRCRFCGSGDNLEVHHVESVTDNIDGLDNLMVLCRSCHRRVPHKSRAPRISQWDKVTAIVIKKEAHIELTQILCDKHLEEYSNVIYFLIDHFKKHEYLI